VRSRREPRERAATHPLGRRIRCTEVGAGCFELTQFGDQSVVLRVRDLGIVEHVVPVVVVLE